MLTSFLYPANIYRSMRAIEALERGVEEVWNMFQVSNDIIVNVEHISNLCLLFLLLTLNN